MADEDIQRPPTEDEDMAEEVDQDVEILEIDGDDAGAPGDDGERLDGVAALRRELADLKDRSMRTLADFDNYRKRSERERRESLRYASADLLRELLEVSDNLERAVAAGGSAEDLKTGVEMTLRQLQDVLRRHGAEEVPAVGEAFDPALHEAVSRQEDPDAEEPRVVEQFQRGYRLHERLLRPARVVVAVPPEEG
ncbi:MAG TPA: nucleotide exchange factor GrpE [Thermoanaerobaculia bacterium]|nr:nucleotide exchange factor GrpE [Thermoanaerobaculia bacterium]